MAPAGDPRAPGTPGPARTGRALVLAATAACLGLLAACGQRGPLYLPDSEPKKKLAMATAADPSGTGALPASAGQPTP